VRAKRPNPGPDALDLDRCGPDGGAPIGIVAAVLVRHDDIPVTVVPKAR
jgi:hypothetical protein